MKSRANNIAPIINRIRAVLIDFSTNFETKKSTTAKTAIDNIRPSAPKPLIKPSESPRPPSNENKPNSVLVIPEKTVDII